MGGPRPPDFEEVQRFHHPGVWVLVAVPVGFAWLAAIWQVFLGNRFGDKPAPDWVVILVWALAGVLLPCWLLALRLVTRVDASGVDVRFRPPLSGRRFPFEDIERCEQVRYLPIREFSGWGIRWGRRGEAVVEITLRQGYRFAVGSRQPDALERAILARLGGEDRG
ncbi:MAG: hypothetical protein A2V75_01915 [Actinobacteria bacterium RBG_16_70_17]|nr:MAG: hypothetical protein A2V75_01915 [Actinobacteria bacterium RBG_16_70_17]